MQVIGCGFSCFAYEYVCLHLLIMTDQILFLMMNLSNGETVTLAMEREVLPDWACNIEVVCVGVR